MATAARAISPARVGGGGKIPLKKEKIFNDAVLGHANFSGVRTGSLWILYVARSNLARERHRKEYVRENAAALEEEETKTRERERESGRRDQNPCAEVEEEEKTDLFVPTVLRVTSEHSPGGDSPGVRRRDRHARVPAPAEAESAGPDAVGLSRRDPQAIRALDPVPRTLFAKILAECGFAAGQTRHGPWQCSRARFKSCKSEKKAEGAADTTPLESARDFGRANRHSIGVSYLAGRFVESIRRRPQTTPRRGSA